MKSSPVKVTLPKHLHPNSVPMIDSQQYERICARYAELVQNHDMPDNKVLVQHLTDGILPGVALFYVLLEQNFTRNEAVEKIDQIFEFLVKKRAGLLNALGRIPFFYAILRARVQSAMRQYPEEGWQTEWVQKDGNAIRFNMRTCFYVDTLKQYDALELILVFCKVDDLIYENMSPYVAWKRTQTIGRGAEFCDFCFERVRKAEK